MSAAAGSGQQAIRLPLSRTTRSALFAIVGCIAALNGFAGKIVSAIWEKPIAVVVMDLGDISAIIWFAIITIFMISKEALDEEASLPWDKAVIALTLMLSFVPINFAGAIGLLLCGLYLALTSAKDSPARRIAIIMLALTGPLIWGRFLLALAGPFLLRLDANLAGLVSGAPVDGNVVMLRDGTSMYVALGCSSVHNMSLAVLLFVTATQLFRLRYTPLVLASGVLAALAMAAINVARLATMALLPQHFDFLHTGWGGSMFGAASFVAAAVIIAVGIRVELSR